ncbi:hypothetical protein [Methylobacterium sp. WL8]|uniref:hypothetical protein n=1 Tax=Methylobacterium sp. WL8 TaxID=2603899 RepID=UPI0011CA6216|nr:hypothetical protein [Methylobacterium sp. WL8]TXN82698.1 hypothetical protein FV234_09145 [Methylobacterium sp. WL8]
MRVVLAMFVVKCPPCQRRDTYDLARLQQRFSKHADLYDVYLRLTQTCSHQQAFGTRQPNLFAG